MTNEEDILPLLKKEGFHIVTGAEGIKEHVRLFRNASLIIGPHGSLFANLIFSERNPTVYEFCPATRQDHNFEGIGKTLGLQYNWISTPCDDQYNIKLEIQKLDRII